jgi:hypothetical protein
MTNAIVSPLINYMCEKHMIQDWSDPISYSMTQSQINFTAAGGGLPTSLAENKPYYFQPNETLDHTNSKIRAIEVVSQSFLSTFPNGTSNVSSDDVLARIMISIVDGKNNVLIYSPLKSLLGVAYGGFARKLYTVDLEDIIWQKSYIEILDTSLLAAGEGILLNVYYDKIPVYDKP